MADDYSLRCDCGAVELRVAGEPVACVYCHCPSCRGFYDLPMLAATAWNPESVTVAAGDASIRRYQHPEKQMQRHFCPDCGETLFGDNRFGLIVILNSVFEKSLGALPDSLQPTMHLFYQDRVVNVADSLPKYREAWDGELFDAGS